MNYWPLLGVAVIVIGFALRFNAVPVVVCAALVSGLLAGLHVPDLLALLGKSFVSSRMLLMFVLTLPAIGLLERAGLREHAQQWLARLRGMTLARLLIGYLLVRQPSRLTALLDIVATAPFAVAGTVLGIGLVLTFNSGFLILTGTWVIMVIAYAVRKLPFSVRSSVGIMHQIEGNLEEASINLGVPPFSTFLRITIPLILSGIVGGLVLSFVTTASELSSTIVLYSGPWTTMTMAMFQALEGTSAGEATAAATILIVFTVLPVALVYRLLRRYELSTL